MDVHLIRQFGPPGPRAIFGAVKHGSGPLVRTQHEDVWILTGPLILGPLDPGFVTVQHFRCTLSHSGDVLSASAH
jgi:hypothetical protein